MLERSALGGYVTGYEESGEMKETYIYSFEGADACWYPVIYPVIGEEVAHHFLSLRGGGGVAEHRNKNRGKDKSARIHDGSVI